MVQGSRDRTSHTAAIPSRGLLELFDLGDPERDDGVNEKLIKSQVLTPVDQSDVDIVVQCWELLSKLSGLLGFWASGLCLSSRACMCDASLCHGPWGDPPTMEIQILP